MHQKKTNFGENEKDYITDDKEILKVFNDFLESISKTLIIPGKNCIESICENVRDPTLKIIKISQPSQLQPSHPNPNIGNKRLNVVQFSFLTRLQKRMPSKQKQEVCDDLGVCVLNILRKVNSLPSLLAINLVKVEIQIF